MNLNNLEKLSKDLNSMMKNARTVLNDLQTHENNEVRELAKRANKGVDEGLKGNTTILENILKDGNNNK